MMYIVYKHPGTPVLKERAEERTWHVGQQPEPLQNEILSIVEVQADCDELEYILNRFTNLPRSTQRVQRWYGDMARFIVGNL